MSHDLYFFKKSGKGCTPRLSRSMKNQIDQNSPRGQETDREILRYLAQFRYFSEPDITPDGFDAGYLNPDTGTQFFLTMNRPTIPVFEKENRFDGYSYAGLSCHLDYCRPLSFIREAAPVIEKISRRFGLAVVDTHDKKFDVSPKNCNARDLIHSYGHANIASIRKMLREKKGIKGPVDPDHSAYFPSEKAHFWWEYMFNKREITTYLEEKGIDLHVPELILMRKKSDEILFTVIALSQRIGYLMPPCDAFYIHRKDFSERRLVSASDLMPLLKPYLNEASVLDKSFFVLSRENAIKFVETLQTIRIDSEVEKYELIPPGGFIEIRTE